MATGLPQWPAERIAALRAALDDADNTWIALASEAQLDDQFEILATALQAADGDIGKLPLYGVPFAIKDNVDAA